MDKENLNAAFFELGRTRKWVYPANKGALKNILNTLDTNLPNWKISKPNPDALRYFKLHGIQIPDTASPSLRALFEAQPTESVHINAQDASAATTVEDECDIVEECPEAVSDNESGQEEDQCDVEEEEEEEEEPPVIKKRVGRKNYSARAFIDDEADDCRGREEADESEDEEEGDSEDDEDDEDDEDEEEEEDDEAEEEEDESYVDEQEPGDEPQGEVDEEEDPAPIIRKKSSHKMVVSDDDEVAWMPTITSSARMPEKISDLGDIMGRMSLGAPGAQEESIQANNEEDSGDEIYESAEEGDVYNDESDGDEEDEEDDTAVRMNIIAQLAKAHNSAPTSPSQLSVKQICEVVSLNSGAEHNSPIKPTYSAVPPVRKLLVVYSDSEDDQDSDVDSEAGAEVDTEADAPVDTPAAEMNTQGNEEYASQEEDRTDQVGSNAPFDNEVVVLSSDDEEEEAVFTKKSRSKTVVVVDDDDESSGLEEIDDESEDDSEEEIEEDSEEDLPAPTPKPRKRAPAATPSASYFTPSAAPRSTPNTSTSKHASTSKPPVSRPKPESALVSPKSAKAFAKTAQAQSERLFAEYNDVVFEGKLPAIPIVWSKKLNTTAGQARLAMKQGEYLCISIELATKVVDSQAKLQSTLLHEMCHAAAWIIDHTRDPPHGDVFKYWARVAERKYSNSVSVGTCHNYEIRYNHTYECTKEGCGFTIGRHSKSIDTERQVCPRCRSTLRLQPRLKKDGTPCTPRTPSRFTSFLKEHLSTTKKNNPNLPHKDVMALLTAKYREMGI